MRNLNYFLAFNLAYAHYYDSSSKSYDSAREGFGADYSRSVSESYDEIYDGRSKRIAKRADSIFNSKFSVFLKTQKRTKMCLILSLELF